MRNWMLGSAAVVVLAGALAVWAEDWPQWRGPRRDGISSQAGLADKWPADGPAKLWTAQVGKGYSSPIAQDGKVYLFSQVDNSKDVLSAFDAVSGRVVWSEAYDRGGTVQYAGARATPAIDGDHIYTYGDQGDLVCRDLATGKLVWRLNVLQSLGEKNLQWGCASCPLVAGGMVYVQGGEGGSVAVAVDQKTGRIAWKSQAVGLSSYAAPVLADVQKTPQLIIFGGDAVWGIDPQTGKTIWSVPWKTHHAINAAMPIYRDGLLFCTSAFDYGCATLKLSATGAEKLWENKLVTCKFQSPILDGDSLFANSEGTLKCLSWPDGKVQWEAKDDALRIGFGGSLVRCGDKLILLSDRGKLMLTRATPQGIELLSSVKLIDENNVWSTPLIYDGRLYAKGAQELMCLDIGGKKP